ncbi:MAG: hypothetical protein JNJ99_00150 [Crocinitomicaceae bacterium]|nr:hypothetical protein [Crocinitomicaceae bacterium]
MKKLVLALGLIAFTGVATNSFSQDGDKTKTSTTSKKSTKKKQGSCCTHGGTSTCSDKKKTETK